MHKTLQEVIKEASPLPWRTGDEFSDGVTSTKFLYSGQKHSSESHCIAETISCYTKKYDINADLIAHFSKYFVQLHQKLEQIATGLESKYPNEKFTELRKLLEQSNKVEISK